MDKAKVLKRIDVQLKARKEAIETFGEGLARTPVPFYDLLWSQDVFTQAGSHHMFYGLRSHIRGLPDGTDVTAKVIDDYLNETLLNITANLIGRSSGVPQGMVNAYIEAMAKFLSSGVAEKLVR